MLDENELDISSLSADFSEDSEDIDSLLSQVEDVISEADISEVTDSADFKESVVASEEGFFYPCFILLADTIPQCIFELIESCTLSDRQLKAYQNNPAITYTEAYGLYLKDKSSGEFLGFDKTFLNKFFVYYKEFKKYCDVIAYTSDGTKFEGLDLELLRPLD